MEMAASGAGITPAAVIVDDPAIDARASVEGSAPAAVAAIKTGLSLGDDESVPFRVVLIVRLGAGWPAFAKKPPGDDARRSAPKRQALNSLGPPARVRCAVR